MRVIHLALFYSCAIIGATVRYIRHGNAAVLVRGKRRRQQKLTETAAAGLSSVFGANGLEALHLELPAVTDDCVGVRTR